jgi:hypothetical protein
VLGFGKADLFDRTSGVPPPADRQAMQDKRSTLRKRRRLLVRFGRTAAFTFDVSGGGLGLGAMQILPVSSTVEGSIQVEETEFSFSGRVAWATPGDRRLSLPGKMGVTFTRATPQLARLLDLSSPSTRLTGT